MEDRRPGAEENWQSPRGRAEGGAGVLPGSLLWLIRLRWVAVFAVAATIVAAHRLGVVERLWPPLLVPVGLALFNAALMMLARRDPGAGLDGSPRRKYRRRIALQLHVDLLALTVLLRWTGGIENPFSLFYVFHIAIGSILLTTRQTVLLVVSGSLLYAALGLGEYWGLLEHHPIHLAPAAGGEVGAALSSSPFLVLGDIVALCMTMAGVAYFVRSVVKRMRRAEALRRQHERIALSRQRLARIGEISAGLAHSIRNPLHGVLNCLELLTQEEQTESCRETLELMREGLGRIQGVTDRLLVLTRDEPLRREPSDLIEQVEELVRFVEPRAAKEGVDLDVALDRIPRVRIDPFRIHEALFNILDNAFDACREAGGKRIRVRAGADEDLRDRVFVEIEDEGPGMPPDRLRRIFDPFYTTKAIGEGTGLGLAIARRVIEEHGGRILVRSTPGRGSAFRVELPLGDTPLVQEGEEG